MCKLTKTTGDLDCHFRGAAGQNVTLTVNGTTGNVLFVSAKYNGMQLVPAGTSPASLQLTLVAGSQMLFIVYGFSSGESGRGQLLEQCDAATTQVLRTDLRGDEPFVAYVVCGGAQ